MVFAASFPGCSSDHDTADVIAQEPTAATDDPARYWDHTFLGVELPDSDFDDTSKKLYVQLVKQDRAWQTGLIHYLGLILHARLIRYRWMEYERSNSG